jgi:hypothetical protein
MTTRAFKSISPQELEAAIASAISVITGTATAVSIGQWKKSDELADRFSSSESYQVQLSITAGKSYGESRVPPGVKVDAVADDDEIKF